MKRKRKKLASSHKKWYDDLVLSIDSEIKKRHKSILKFLFRDTLPAILLEEGEPLEWFQKLEHREILSWSNVSVLKEFLDKAKLYDMVSQVDDYETKISILIFFKHHLMKLQQMHQLGKLNVQGTCIQYINPLWISLLYEELD